jgi:hypothetical protein
MAAKPVKASALLEPLEGGVVDGGVDGPSKLAPIWHEMLFTLAMIWCEPVDSVVGIVTVVFRTPDPSVVVVPRTVAGVSRLSVTGVFAGKSDPDTVAGCPGARFTVPTVNVHGAGGG